MSKSLGNVVRPLEMQARYGMDAFRYFLLREMAFGQDAEFSEAALVTRLNADLANGLGNLASRMLAMQQRYFEGAVQPLAPEPADLALRDGLRRRARRELDAHVAALAFHRALEALWRALDHANKYVVETAPFTLAKDPAQRPRVGAILHELCEALRVTAQLVAPFLPETARAPRRLARAAASDARPRSTCPGARPSPPGHRTLPPEALFPRVEARAVVSGAAARRLALPRRRAGVRRRPRRGPRARRGGRRHDRSSASAPTGPVDAQRARRSRSPARRGGVRRRRHRRRPPARRRHRRRRRASRRSTRSPPRRGSSRIGETGLDYHYDHSPRAAQRDAFARTSRSPRARPAARRPRARRARRRRRRSCARRARPTSAASSTASPATRDDARRYLDLGFHISFTGIVTFKNADALREAVRLVPLDRLLVETDAPFLAPVPHRGQRNEPALRPRVVGRGRRRRSRGEPLFRRRPRPTTRRTRARLLRARPRYS